VRAPLVLSILSWPMLTLLPAPARAADKASCLAAHESSQAERKQGRLLAAQATLAKCAEESCPGPVRADCAKWLGEVEAAVPTVVIRVVDENGKDPTSTTKGELDAHPVALDGLPIRVDPGKHVVVVRRADGATRTASIVVVEGEHDRVLTLTFESPKPAARRSFAPLVLAGVSALALGGFVVVGLTTNAKLRELEDNCAPRCDPGERDAVARRYLVGDVLLGVGVVSLGAAVTVYLLDRPATATVAPTAGGAFASVRFVF